MNLQTSGHCVGDPFIIVTQGWPENEPPLRKTQWHGELCLGFPSEIIQNKVLRDNIPTLGIFEKQCS